MESVLSRSSRKSPREGSDGLTFNHMPIPEPITIARRVESMIDLSHGPIPGLKGKQMEPADLAEPMRWGRGGSPKAESWSEERLQRPLKPGFKSWLLRSLARSPRTS